MDVPQKHGYCSIQTVTASCFEADVSVAKREVMGMGVK